MAAREPEEPIRGELFSIERLEQHAESLAAAQRVTGTPGRGRPLATRLRDNYRVLLVAYRAIGAAIREERAITPAAEWLVDNFHIAEEQIREIRDDLPRGFYRQLPKLAEGPLEGYPRVFGLAWAFVAHTDSLFDPQTLCRFVRAYQRVQPLTIGELWAVAITLRIVLVENLRRAAERIVSSRAARQEADALADRLLGAGSGAAEAAATALQPFEQRALPRAFAVQLVQRLRDQDPAVTPALRWLDERLAAQGTTADEIVREEHQRQGAMNVTVRNVITSMRLMSAVDWAELFESVSLVDAALRADSDFAAMDFPTRDQYRHAVEELARGSGLPELEVTRRRDCRDRASENRSDEAAATRSAPSRTPGTSSSREGVGPSRGRSDFVSRSGIGWAVATPRRACSVTWQPWPSSPPSSSRSRCAASRRSGSADGSSCSSRFAALVPASDAAVVLVNRHVTNQFGPKALPGMELRDGVPSALRTLVAVPTLLTTREAIEEQIEHLEVHHLAGPEDDFCFALLSDWTDSSTESAPGGRGPSRRRRGRHRTPESTIRKAAGW